MFRRAMLCAVALLGLLSAVAAAADCVSGQLPRVCTVTRVAGTAYDSALNSTAPASRPLVNDATPALSAVLTAPAAVVASRTRNTLYFTEKGRHVVSALDLGTGTSA